MSQELATVIREIMDEAVEYTRDLKTEHEIEERTLVHVLNRWYRFAPFGVESRAQLRGLKILCVLAPGRSRISLVVAGTPLEGR